MKNRNCPIFALALLALVLTSLQSLAQSTYEPYTFITLAGTAGYGIEDGTGTVARFGHPQGVAVDSKGNVYVADGNNTIRKVTPAGALTTLAGLGGSSGSEDGTGSEARFNQPSGVAVDSEGNIYVADIYNNTIRKVTPTGVVMTLAGLAGNRGSEDGTGSDARFYYPSGVAVDSEGSVYVADSGNNTIRKVTPTGVVTTLAGLAGWRGGTNDGPGSAARFGGLDAGPTAVAVDSTGNVYVADTFNYTIRKVSPTGVVTTLAGLAGNGGSADGTGSDARFFQAHGVAVDSAGNVYVADTFNYTIRKVTQAGVVTTLAGLAGRYGTADGTGNGARFGGSFGVAVDSAGNLYVPDQGNETIRKGYPALAITASGPNFGFSGGKFGFNLTGPTGKLVVVETSSDLVNWLAVWTNTFAGALKFSDPQSSISSKRFYRAHTP